MNATTFTAEIDTGFGPQLVTVVGNQAQTYTQLVDIVGGQLSAATTNLVDGNIVIAAGNTQVSITNDNLFVNLTDFVEIFNSDTGEGDHLVVPPFADDWVQLERVVKDLIPARDRAGGAGGTLYFVARGVFPNNIQDGDDVDIYINGTFFESQTVSSSAVVLEVADVGNDSFVTVVDEIVPLTDEEQDFDPDAFDDGSFLVQRKEDRNYTVRNVLDEFGATTQIYFFWVRDKTTRVDQNPSLAIAENELTTIPIPYIFFDKFVVEGFSAGGTPVAGLPARYTQTFIKGLAGIINDDDRYVLRFTRDFTLRDRLTPRDYPSDLEIPQDPTTLADFSRVKQEPLDLKNLHAEWTLLREGQPSKIPRSLWDKITEAVIGRLLSDPLIRVPSLERELYDLRNSTETQYGFGDGQAFVNGQLALATVLDDLTDSSNDFSPVDINSFFLTHEFVTEAGIIEAFDDIYNLFRVEDVNRMYFEILLDALSTKSKYPDVFKTSWVSLEGSQLLQTEAVVNG